ncbi:uncharacterized protein FOMMEDRAFT_152504 [Fomitiporia mediterranea MF3/22]|uniref:uncharacterized protein n=1 Tax=Fomitiporia mediterranea (strain MF3/22) TaxID=694068 RepID=UPI0004407CDF|nr:uncharacterized protein FOMMEDRAFT_152504 [Fomitiporia mediterranea MF3/22]EJD07145.1 hypothetical protein FOMMEDRAFT_152504 [Fomitiporia mediterranea MF3/22]
MKKAANTDLLVYGESLPHRLQEGASQMLEIAPWSPIPVTNTYVRFNTTGSNRIGTPAGSFVISLRVVCMEAAIVRMWGITGSDEGDRKKQCVRGMPAIGYTAYRGRTTVGDGQLIGSRLTRRGIQGTIGQGKQELLRSATWMRWTKRVEVTNMYGERDGIAAEGKRG